MAVIGAVAAALAVCLLVASPAGAGSVSGVPNVSLGGVGCASDGSCWAAGETEQGSPGVLVPISAGKPGSPKQIPGTQELDAVACESSTTCLAVGGSGSEGVVVPIIDGVPGSPQLVAGTLDLHGIACPTSSSCVAVGFGAGRPSTGTIVPISGTTPGTAQPVSSGFLSGVACQNADHCVAVGQAPGNTNGAVVAITNDQPGPIQEVGQGQGFSTLQGVACAPGTSSCLAVGAQSGQSEPYAQLVPISNGTTGPVKLASNPSRFSGVACKTATSCLAVGSSAPDAHTALGAAYFPIDSSGTAGAATSEPGDALQGVACWSTASCVAVGDKEAILIGSATPSPGMVSAAVAKSLSVSGRGATIAAILSAGGYSATVSAPGAGKLKITWSFLAPGARKPIIVAQGTKTFGAAGSAKLKLRLTPQGRALLKRATRIKLTAVGSFALKQGKTVTKRKSITLNKH